MYNDSERYERGRGKTERNFNGKGTPCLWVLRCMPRLSACCLRKRKYCRDPAFAVLMNIIEYEYYNPKK